MSVALSRGRRSAVCGAGWERRGTEQ